MAELRAQRSHAGEGWRRSLPDREEVIVGRASGLFSVTWDLFVSRRHAKLIHESGKLVVERVPEAANPIYFGGTAQDRFTLNPGQHFVIGETSFTFEDVRPETPGSSRSEDEAPVQTRTISAPELERVPLRNARHQIDVLSRLPQVISGATDDEELYVRVTELLLAGVRRADVAALVAIDCERENSVQVLHWESRAGAMAEFKPSRQLAREAIIKQEQTIVHMWKSDAGDTEIQATQGVEGFDWAYCCPLRGDVCNGWGLYLTGRFDSEAAGTLMAPLEQSELGDDLKFTELVGAILASLRQVQQLERRQSSLGTFFSPAVVRIISNSDPDTALKAREEEVSVLFCDLRGFSRQAEHQAQQLLMLLERVSKALGVMTKSIFDKGGVIADFQGDAALGFWGWPLPMPNKIEQACLAALEIRSLVEASAQRPDHPLAGFQVGIGLATGQAVAGKIGTSGQAKIGVFGPVVNLASRLEGMTKILRAPILVDMKTASAATERLSRDICRSRRLAVVQPYGLDTPLTVAELLPGPAESPLSDDDLRSYEFALDAFVAGQWEKAYDLLHALPARDRGKDFLLGNIIQHNHQPPTGWNGVVTLTSKS
ncbi:MAG: adenylate/guanylate cyclase domain-containing protein [Gemmataceae bacterium]|nr:adenylate/guanylate cyclase domain-containing protein [Gemmataceae bacterium]